MGITKPFKMIFKGKGAGGTDSGRNRVEGNILSKAQVAKQTALGIDKAEVWRSWDFLQAEEIEKLLEAARIRRAFFLKENNVGGSLLLGHNFLFG